MHVIHPSPILHTPVSLRPATVSASGAAAPPTFTDAPDPVGSMDVVTSVFEVGEYATRPQLIGIVLAISGNLIISFSLALTKYAHNLNAQQVEPLPYTHLPLWWCGLAATVIGEAGNFAAYGFAGASLIAPLGAVSVLANAFISAFGLKEGLRFRDAVGCVLCMAGGCTIVLATPSDSKELGPDGFVAALQATPFLIYITVLLALVALMLGFQDVYGHRHVAYYVLLCSLLGSVTVMSSKGVSTFLNLWLCCGAPSPFSQPVLYPVVLVLAVTAILQINFLNKAMERFGNTETVPVYYVLFTLTTITGSNVLYRDFENEDLGTVVTFGCGCVLTFAGVKLLTSSKHGLPHGSHANALSGLSGSPAAAPLMDDKERAFAALMGEGGAGGACAPGVRPDRGHVRSASSGGGGGSGLAIAINGESGGNGQGGAFPYALHPFDEEYEQMQPLALLNSPLGVSGDVLRRTFSNRLTTFAERAARLGGRPRTNSF